eukprot:2480168-Rhodomonas_salina.1
MACCRPEKSDAQPRRGLLSAGTVGGAGNEGPKTLLPLNCITIGSFCVFLACCNKMCFWAAELTGIEEPGKSVPGGTSYPPNTLVPVRSL